MIKKTQAAKVSRKRTPRYAKTPTSGDTFGTWLIDLLTETVTNVDRGLTWESALEWQDEWIGEDRQCIPLIVRDSYEIPKTMYVSDYTVD